MARFLRVTAFLPLAVSLTLTAACSRSARTPEDAHRRFAQAVRAADTAALFRSLDQKSRWSWMTVQRCHREAYDIILSSYPEDQARERELRRFEAGAMAAGAPELFTAAVGAAALPSLQPLAADGARIELRGDEADAIAPSSARVPLRRGEDGGWGYAGFLADSEDRARRAFHDLELVRASAVDYERAAARASK